MAANTLWCFLVPLVVVICTAFAASITSEEEFVTPIHLTEATNVEKTPRCPSKERWDKCGALCQRNCTNFNEHPGVCPLPCVPGCVCAPGYVRGANGRCVKSKECPGSKKCPRGERYDECSYLCQKNCTNHQSNEPCTYSCHPGCVCPEGHVRSVFPSGKCIKVEKCPKRAEDEIVDEDPEDSEDIDDSLERDEDYDDSEEDRDDALGKRGFCPKNEEFVKCDAKYEPDCGNTTLSKSVCVSGCRCESGYVRGPRGTCIKKEECPEKDNTEYPVKRICPRYEYWNKHVAHCQKNCTLKELPCPKIPVSGCICKRGFLRRDDGKCVLKKRCPKTIESEQSREDQQPKSFCPPNEVFAACLGHCEPNCTNKTVRFCDRSVCVSECQCLWGFVRGPKGDCIKPEKCPSIDPVKRKCPAKEQWETSRAHCQTNCTTLGKKIPCSKIAVAGCVCKKDTYRNKKGECVPKKQCPKKAEEFDVSTEDDLGTDISTEEPSWLRTTDDDHDEISWRNDEDWDAKAQSYCPPNEVFAACNGHCEPNCTIKTLQSCDRSVCVSECKCLWGFVRGPKGDCIKPEKCPSTDPVKRKCPANEQWEPSRAHCQTNCTTLGKKIPCAKIAVAGCVCKKDNYRNKKGECVPKKQCAKNAEEFDVSTEDDLGTDISTEEPSWLRSTDDDHDEISWRNDEDWDAKAKSYCPPNEVFSACFGHCEPDCKNKNKTLADCNKSVCVSECKCLWGFVRGPKGDCIKPEKCPANDKTKYPVKRKCPAKEQWELSRAHCQTNCTTLGKKITCAKIAVAGCVCKKDNYRNKKGECVPKKQCPKKAEEFEVSTEDDLTTEFSSDESSWLHLDGGDDVENWDVNDARDDDLTTEFSTEEPLWLHPDADDVVVENRDVNDARGEVLEEPGGCPNSRKCNKYCREKGKPYGRCHGYKGKTCTCRR